MPVLLDDHDFCVWSKWYAGYRVLYKGTGATIIPDLDLCIKLQQVIRAAKTGKYWDIYQDAPHLNLIIYEIFAVSAFDPKGEVADAFRQGSINDIVENAHIECMQRIEKLFSR